MQGTIIENLSGKKLLVLVILLIVSQVVSFLVGGLIAPTPSASQPILGTRCKDERHNKSISDNVWFYSRGEGSCKDVETTEYYNGQILPYHMVFTFQMPLPRDKKDLDYSRWQHSLIGIVQIEAAYDKQLPMAPSTKITFDARLAFRNKGDPDNAWQPYASSVVERNLECHLDSEADKSLYSCSVLSLFELGSLYHDYYLLNLRLPIDTERKINAGLGHIENIYLITIHQNGGFTKVWVSLKTVFFPIIAVLLFWYWRRVHMLSRSPALLEYMLLALGGALTLLNIPFEYLTLMFDMPFMLLLEDVRQGIFYAILLSFWLVFAGEHLMIQEGEEKNSLKNYGRHLSAVGVGCLSLLLFDICERGVQLRNPFFSIWTTDAGAKTAFTFIVLAGISAGFYLLFLCYMIWKVFMNISTKRAALPSMSSVRRLHYEGVIYRFKFLMMATFLCASLTIIGFILGQVAEGQFKWDPDTDLQMTSALFTGIYGMWNVYIISLLCLYAPSHKQWPIEPSENSISEEIEFSRLPTEPNEMLSLTGLSRKATVD